VFTGKSRQAIAASLVFAVFLWGGNNTGVKVLVASWPPIFVGATRFLCAGLLLLSVLKWTHWLGQAVPITPDLNRRLWQRGGLSLAVYIAVFNFAVQCTAVSHVALYLGAAPIWALMLEERTDKQPRDWLKRYVAAGLALVGVAVLLWPALKAGGAGMRPIGEFLGLAASFLWTHYGRQCRALGGSLPGVEITAHTMWRAGVLLIPLALVEVMARGLKSGPDLLLIQGYCVLFGGVVAFGLWTSALRHWKTSEVYLFNNLVPLSTMLWARAWLGERVTPTFWLAMVLIVGGVLLGQTNWQRLFGTRWLPPE
jgi:drug/metabolite transporter (DMT)-like permease